MSIILTGSSGSKLDEIQRQLLLMQGQMKEMSDIIKEFASCRACMKKFYRKSPTTDDDLHRSNVMQTPMHKPPVSSPIEKPSSSVMPSPPESSEQFDAITIQNNQRSQPAQARVLIGSPSRGIYVKKAQIETIKSECPKRHALKLFEILFARQEAKASSLEGKGDRLSKLDGNRVFALKEHIEQKFASNPKYNWPEIKKAIDEKCRMVRNNRCFVWAGVNHNAPASD